jgi:hypothetical protein
MPCFSIVTRTAMTNAERLAEAMRASGHNRVEIQRGGLSVVSDRASFVRSSASEGFVTRAPLGTIGKRYAELGVREWARRAGYNVLSLEDDQMTLVNRRG